MNDAPIRSKKMIWANFITVISAAVLMGTVVIGMALATSWALAGLLGLGTIGGWVLDGIFSLTGIAAIVAFVRNASRIEPFFER